MERAFYTKLKKAVETRGYYVGLEMDFIRDTYKSIIYNLERKLTPQILHGHISHANIEVIANNIVQDMEEILITETNKQHGEIK